MQRKSWSSRLRQLFWPSLDAAPRKRRKSDSSGSSDEFDASVLLPSWNQDSAISYSHEYRLAWSIAFVVFLHFLAFTIVTLMLLLSLPKSDVPEIPNRPDHPATRLGGVLLLVFGNSELNRVVLQFNTGLRFLESLPCCWRVFNIFRNFA
jgi:hypothetical protein